MKSLTFAGALAVSCLLTGAGASAAADDATMFRVFLNGGSSLVSYGEIARVGDHVVPEFARFPVRRHAEQPGSPDGSPSAFTPGERTSTSASRQAAQYRREPTPRS
jgi:hypothetical protein